jgi:hypothetical protein
MASSESSVSTPVDATNKNTQWTTYLALIQAVGTAVVDFVVHTPMEGGALKQPTFWVGLVIAAAMGLKGYLTQGIPDAGHAVVTAPKP